MIKTTEVLDITVSEVFNILSGKAYTDIKSPEYKKLQQAVTMGWVKQHSHTQYDLNPSCEDLFRNELYIVEEEYKGYINTTVKYNGRYWEELYSQLSLNQYLYLKKQEDKERGEERKFHIITLTQFLELLEVYRESLITGLTEITEDKYYEMLNVLPPVRSTNIGMGFYFFLGEAYSGALHSFYASYRGKYYTALRSIYEKDEDLARLIYDKYKEVENG